MLLVNLFGGPGCGKSLTAFGLAYHLKRRGVNTGYIPEFAKDLVYGERWDLLADQEHILDVQHNRQVLLEGKVDIAITDTSLLNGLIYAPADYSQEAIERTVALWSDFNNVNFLIKRCPKYGYETAGRFQDETGALLVDDKVESVLHAYGVNFTTVWSETAVDDILAALGHERIAKV